jgi:hypothetical protein
MPRTLLGDKKDDPYYFWGLECENERYLLIIWTSQWRKLRPNPSYYHQFTTSLLHRHHQILPGISTKVYCFHLSEVLRAYVPIPTAVSCSDLFIVICRHHAVSIFAAIHRDNRCSFDHWRGEKIVLTMGRLISTSRSAVLKKCSPEANSEQYSSRHHSTSSEYCRWFCNETVSNFHQPCSLSAVLSRHNCGRCLDNCGK